MINQSPFPLAQNFWINFYRKKPEGENQVLREFQVSVDPLREVREAIRYINLARHDE